MKVTEGYDGQSLVAPNLSFLFFSPPHLHFKKNVTTPFGIDVFLKWKKTLMDPLNKNVTKFTEV